MLPYTILLIYDDTSGIKCEQSTTVISEENVKLIKNELLDIVVFREEKMK